MTAPDERKLTDMLRDVGLRPTRQRLALAGLLFAHGDRHVTAEELHREAAETGLSVSLATVYNTLNQFSDAGLLRQVITDGARTFYDTNTRDHYHFYAEEDGRLIDIPADQIDLGRLPPPPDGARLAGVDVIIRLRKAGA